MAPRARIALLGFRPWSDPSRQIEVRENPSGMAAEGAVAVLASKGIAAVFVPVEVSGEGIVQAMELVRAYAPAIVVAAGQTTGGPRVEKQGRVPGAWAPAQPGEEQPWLLAPDADLLAARLAGFADPAALTDPMKVSDDAGGYFCDHLCVELVRESRRRRVQARFLHVTAIDGAEASVRAARLRLSLRHLVACVEWLRSPSVA